MAKIAWLIFTPSKIRAKTYRTFDGRKNVGAMVLMDVMRRNNISFSFCDVNTAQNYDIILVSLTSSDDLIAFYKSVRLLKEWQPGKRRFYVSVGGFGLNNVLPIRDYVDGAWFGRTENEWVEYINNFMDYEHESFLRIKNGIKDVKINQVKEFYPHELEIDGRKWNECMYGCPNLCFFCNYSFSRKHIKTTKNYFVESTILSTQKTSQEIDMFNMDSFNPDIPYTIVGLDGISEVDRFFVNKKISNRQIKDFFLNFTSKSRIKSDTCLFKIYNIAGYETSQKENEGVDEFVSNFTEIDKSLKKSVVIQLHTTPLNPSICTPIAYSKIDLFNDFFYIRKGTDIATGQNFKIYHSRYNPSNYDQFLQTLIIRYTDEYKKLLDFVLFSNKFKLLYAKQKIKYLVEHFDLNNLTRRYETSEMLPNGYIHGYIEDEKLKNLREIQVRKLKELNKY